MNLTCDASPTQTDNAGMGSYEENFNKLKEIVHELESGNVPLERGMQLFKEGVSRSNACRTMLEEARHQLHKWQNGGEVPITIDAQVAEPKVSR